MPKVASASIGARYEFNIQALENIIYRGVRTRVEGSIWVIKKNRMRGFFHLKRNRASPYAAGMDNMVEISVEPAEMMALFLNPLKVSPEADSCFLKASKVRFSGHNGVGI